MTQKPPITVRLYRCNGCDRIYGQETVDGIPKHLTPQAAAATHRSVCRE